MLQSLFENNPLSSGVNTPSYRRLLSDSILPLCWCVRKVKILLCISPLSTCSQLAQVIPNILKNLQTFVDLVSVFYVSVWFQADSTMLRSGLCGVRPCSRTLCSSCLCRSLWVWLQVKGHCHAAEIFWDWFRFLLGETDVWWIRI